MEEYLTPQSWLKENVMGGYIAFLTKWSHLYIRMVIEGIRFVYKILLLLKVICIS